MNPAAPSGTASGVAYEKVQTQAQQRTRLKGRNLEYYSMPRLATITASFIKNNWTQEKKLRLRADDNSIEEVVYNPTETQRLEYTMSMDPGSMAGVDKDKLLAFHFMLLSGGFTDLDMFLSASPEFPGKHIYITKLKEKNEQAAQMQQAVAQVQQAAQAQIDQVTQQAQAISAENEKHKEENLIMKQVMSPDEKRQHQEMLRQAAIASIKQQDEMENIAANEGQA